MQETLQNRRKAFFNGNEDVEILILHSGKGSEDGFHVNRNFYYYTDIDRDNMILLLTKVNGFYDEVLFIEPYDELMAKWVGGKMLPEEAQEKSGIGEIRYIEDFDSVLSRILNMRRGKDVVIYADLWHSDITINPITEILDKYRKNFPALIIRDAWLNITNQRMIKDEKEIERMKIAQEHTRQAIEAMMKHAKPGMNEMEMEGAFDFALSCCTIREHAFPTICAGGVRATTLHYGDNNQIVNDGEMVLIDLGSAYKHYCADISRTFPVNGKFTERQKEVYNTVLACQKMIINSAKPGMTLRQLNNMVIQFYKENLPKIGLTKNVSEYYYHGVSHHLGLVCHDVTNPDLVLAPGNVITVEPGLYIEDEAIGVRIEDDILITETGCIDLSENILKEVEDIEKLMAS